MNTRSNSVRRGLRALAGLVALTTVAAAAACGSDSSSTSPTGGGTSFSATVTGGSAGSYSGSASATNVAGLFNLGLATLDGKFLIGLQRQGARPTAGTYQVTTGTLTNFSGTLNVNNNQALYGLTGTLTITESSSSAVKGSFDLTGKLTSGSTTNTVKGDFSATCPAGC